MDGIIYEKSISNNDRNFDIFFNKKTNIYHISRFLSFIHIYIKVYNLIKISLLSFKHSIHRFSYDILTFHKIEYLIINKNMIIH